MLTQSVIISLFALLYGVMDDVNSVFLTLTNATTIVYCIVYVLIAIALIKLRYIMPNADRAYRIGKRGNSMAWILSGILVLSIAFAIFATMITTSAFEATLVICLSAILFVIPLIIYSNKKDSWNPVNE